MDKRRSNVLKLVNIVQSYLSLAVEEEEYELAAQLKSYQDQLGNYVTGYCAYEDIVPICYGICVAKGTIMALTESYYTTIADFVLDGTGWSFEIKSDEEFTRLSKMMERRELGLK